MELELGLLSETKFGLLSETKFGLLSEMVLSMLLDGVELTLEMKLGRFTPPTAPPAILKFHPSRSRENQSDHFEKLVRIVFELPEAGIWTSQIGTSLKKNNRS